MTTLHNSSKKCGCCGKQTDVLAVGSTNAFGSCDLDLRPPEMERSAMFHFMQFCEHCGYAARDLEEPIPMSNELKAILSEKISSHDKIKVFERAAEIAVLKGDKKENVDYLYLTAAWAADDLGDDAAALLRRKILANHQGEEKLSPENLLQLIDVARRCGERETAAKLLQRFDECKTEPLLKRIAAFQKKLIQNGDTACYTVEDVETGGRGKCEP